MKLSIRKAVRSDCKAVWTWRNDPVTRANSRNTAKIPWRKHVSWFAETFERGNPQIFIVTAGRVRAGLVSLRMNGKRAEVSVNIAPSFRGKGVGSKAIALACKIAAKLGLVSLEAFVKKTNAASQKAFEKNDFVKNSCKKGLCKYCRRLVS